MYSVMFVGKRVSVIFPSSRSSLPLIRSKINMIVFSFASCSFCFVSSGFKDSILARLGEERRWVLVVPPQGRIELLLILMRLLILLICRGRVSHPICYGWWLHDVFIIRVIGGEILAWEATWAWVAFKVLHQKLLFRLPLF